jgi:hypothetical protein
MQSVWENGERVHMPSLNYCILNTEKSDTTDSHHCKDFLVFNVELVFSTEYLGTRMVRISPYQFLHA